ncbi:Mesothelin-like protein [Platysternon megacephalum]|uniref:Mesothelin-like protein n=1 Tax=Platysternon megacephalum TaxID=55544 RepID=A0A4D9ETI5_9SAUR|nr:Mesothelin-like protein [Platysternon megacephalum]
MSFVTTSTVTEYIDELNRQANLSLRGDIRAALLQHVLAAAQPIFQKAEDAEFVHWMDPRLAGLISGLNSTHVPLVFNGLESRNCSAINAVVTVLNSSITDFSNTTRQSIYRGILNATAGSSLRCYATSTSFAVYLRETFQGFAAFLNLRDLASIVPASEIQTIVNTVAPAALADLLSSSDFLNDNNFLTVLLKNYKRRGAFMDLFNKRSIVDTLPNDTKTAVLAGVWPAVLRSDNETVVDTWLSARLSQYFRFIQGNILNFRGTRNASCTAFRKIVGKLSDNITAFKVSQQEIYNFTKAYLTATSARPRCYNASDPRTANWFAAYLGRSIRYSSADDVRSFINNNATLLQDLAINPDNLRLINHTRIHKDVAELYATALFAKNSNFSLVNLPEQLLCFARRSTAIRLLSASASLSIIARINLHCGPSNASELKDPFTTDHQLATMLVAQITTFDARTLAALGQQAVGLTSGQILELRAQDIADPLALQSLGQVNGWDRGQSQGLMNKLISSNFTFDTAEAFQRLGTLVPGLPSRVFSNITADTAMKMVKNANFHRAIKKAPGYLKRAFVNKIISNASSLNDILNNVPDDLVDQVPIPLLVFRDKLLDLRKINEKQWSSEQAAVFFVDVLNATDSYADLSAAVLQGFQCGAASRLSPDKISSLVEHVKNQNAVLSAHQLSCMAKILAAKNLTANFTSYPPDVLLFFDFTQVQNHTCKEFYSLASQGDLNLLPNGSAQRTQLLNNALVCLGRVNNTLSKEQLSSLGALVCDMDPAAITDSDPRILENLKLCPDLAGAQKAALNALLSSGESQDGAPLSWDLGSLQSLGSLTLYLNQTTWRSVKEGVRKAFFRSVVAGYQTQSASQKEKTMLLLKSIGSASPSSPRSKRATEQCKSEPITASTIQDPLFIVYYDTKGQFDACLSNEVLKANLVPLLEHPLTEEYLDVMKRKLSEIYPAGIPEDQLKLFGQLSRLYDGNEISTWRVTSSDTLSALLDPSGGRWKASGAKQLITRYTDLGGTLTGPLLQKIGGRDLCGLDDDQINKISPEAIGTAGKLDISSCSQSKKDRLYAKARDAFASQTGTSAYYPLIQPYVGGAPTKDLERLAGSNIAMDIETFTSLKPSELQNLSVQNVKNLLGVNLPDLKRAENHPSVTSWIQRHYQSELDSVLGIGLHGGMSEPVSMATASIETSATPDTSTSPPATTYNVKTPHDTTSPPAIMAPLATIHNTTTIDNTTSPPATTYNVTIPHETTAPPAIIASLATIHNITTTHNTTSPPATTYNTTIPHNTTSPHTTTYNDTIPHNTTSLPLFGEKSSTRASRQDQEQQHAENPPRTLHIGSLCPIHGDAKPSPAELPRPSPPQEQHLMPTVHLLGQQG